MYLGRVIGSLVARRKVPPVEGVKLLVVQPLDHNRDKAGKPIVACDAVQAGPGELIFYVTGREASLALPKPFNPSDATITGIVDEIDAEPAD
jgi:ethanolamine utilization protein EutN